MAVQRRSYSPGAGSSGLSGPGGLTGMIGRLISGGDNSNTPLSDGSGGGARNIAGNALGGSRSGSRSSTGDASTPARQALGQGGRTGPSTGWESRAMDDPDEFMRANEQARQAQQAQGQDMSALMDMLFGEGGGNQAMIDALGQSYDDQISAIRGGMGEIEGHYDDLIGGIGDSAGAATDSIGGFYDYASQAAQGGRPVVQEAGSTAQGELDAIYDTLAGNLGDIPGFAQGQADRAGGEGAYVTDRVEAAAAPFRAAGETGRAASQANVVQGTAAADNYLSQLSAAAPSEAAQQQGQVSARADQAVTSAQMALAEQQSQMEAEAAQLEGAKQRALIEHTADVGGDTFQRFMQQAQLFDALGADKSVLRDSMGLPAAPQQGEALGYEDQLDIATKEQRLRDMQEPDNPYDQFTQALPQSHTIQQHGQQLMDLVESQGLTDPAEKRALGEQLINQMTMDDGVDIGTTGEDGMIGSALDNLALYFNPTARRPGDPKVTRDEERVEDMSALLADPEAQMWTPFDPSHLRSALRRAYN